MLPFFQTNIEGWIEAAFAVARSTEGFYLSLVAFAIFAILGVYLLLENIPKDRPFTQQEKKDVFYALVFLSCALTFLVFGLYALCYVTSIVVSLIIYLGLKAGHSLLDQMLPSDPE